jgi:hypothetical protein
MKLRKKTIWSINLHVQGSLAVREQYLTIRVVARGRDAAARKATAVAHQKMGAILADIHVMTTANYPIWY